MNYRILLSALVILTLGFTLHTFHPASSTPGGNHTSDLENKGEPFINTQNLYFPLTNTHSQTPEFAELDRMVRHFLDHWEVKGASLAIVKDGKLVYAQGFGFADQEKNIRVQPYHLFRMASVSKLFTAVGIMKLVEDGKLSLQDKVFGKTGILNDPTFQNIADPLALKIEVKHLLTHTGGWRNQLRKDPMFAPVEVAEVMQVPSPPSLETTIQYMLSQEGFFEPGTLYDYSNFGYCVLGKVIEKISGLTYENYLQKEILHPLGITRMAMTHNRYKEKTPLEVRYYDHPKTPLNISFYGGPDSASRTYEGTHTEGLGAAGAWIATPVDVLKFLNAIDGRPNPKDILHKSTIIEMTTPQAEDSTGRYLLGWKSVDQEKWWRTGSLTGTSASLVRRTDGISWYFVTNTDSWRGPFFAYEIEAMMRRALHTVEHWPKYDLYDLQP